MLSLNYAVLPKKAPALHGVRSMQGRGIILILRLYRADKGCGVGGLEIGAARDENVRAVIAADPCRLYIDAAVNLQLAGWVLLVDPLAELMQLRLGTVQERLSAKARLSLYAAPCSAESPEARRRDCFCRAASGRPCGRPVSRRPYPGEKARARSLPRRVWPRLREN